MSDLPSYYHLSPSQIDELSFRVTVRQARGSGGDPSGDALLSRDIAWQEKILRPTDAQNRPVCIFTYTNADALPFDETSPSIRKDDLRVVTSDRSFSLKSDLYQRAESTLRHEKHDRLLRENACQTMVIMAGTDKKDEVLCVLKLYPNTGLVSSYPGWSEVETNSNDNSSVFMSNRSIEDVLDKGTRLATYSFMLAGSVYEYAIEWNGARSIGDETELMIENQHIIDKEVNDERRDLIRKEFDPYDCMCEKNGIWNNQAHIELVSADGFSVPNLLMCMPHGPSIEVRYRIIKRREKYQKKDDVILSGATASVQRYSTVHESVEFVAYFIVAYVCVAFVSQWWDVANIVRSHHLTLSSFLCTATGIGASTELYRRCICAKCATIYCPASATVQREYDWYYGSLAHQPPNYTALRQSRRYPVAKGEK